MAPVRAWTSATTASRSTLVDPLNITSAPWDCVPAIFEGVLIRGMMMYAGMPRVEAARARACAWFPISPPKKPINAYSTQYFTRSAGVRAI